MARLSDLGERGFLRRFLPRFTAAAPGRFRVPPGDDAAVLSGRFPATLTIDGLTEGTHFKSSWARRCAAAGFSLGRGLGWKLMTVNLSDLASMGATTHKWALIYLGAPGSLPVSFLSDFYRGLREVGDPAGCVIAGGDTVRAKDLSLVAAVGGELKGRPLTRSGARPGDFLCVAGTVGDAPAGLAVLLGKSRVRDRAAARYFVKQFFRPPSLLKEGAILSSERGVTSAIDLSDSLLETVQILCAMSKVGARVNVNAIPISSTYARVFGPSPALLAGGEDYSLLFTLKKNRAAALRRRMRFAVIGELEAARGGLHLVWNGRALRPPRAFQHFG